jgi:hypothetical protein
MYGMGSMEYSNARNFIWKGSWGFWLLKVLQEPKEIDSHLGLYEHVSSI